MLLFSIVTTAAMVGLSSGDCCTQRRPICTHLSNSNRSSGFGCATFESRSSLIVPWFQDSQACETQLQKFMIVQQEGKERMPCRFSMVPSRWAHIRKEHWRGSVPLTTDYLEQDNSKAIHVTLQCQVPLQYVLRSCVSSENEINKEHVGR